MLPNLIGDAVRGAAAVCDSLHRPCNQQGAVMVAGGTRTCRARGRHRRHGLDARPLHPAHRHPCGSIQGNGFTFVGWRSGRPSQKQPAVPVWGVHICDDEGNELMVSARPSTPSARRCLRYPNDPVKSRPRGTPTAPRRRPRGYRARGLGQWFFGKASSRPPVVAGSGQRVVTTLPRVKKCTPSVPWAWVSPKSEAFHPPKE